MKRSILMAMLVSTMVILLSSCTTPLQVAEKALSNGDYGGAVEASIHALDEEPGLLDAHMILGKAWRSANTEWVSAIENLELSEDVWQVDKAMVYYDALVQLHRIVQDAGYTNLNPSAEPESWSKKRATALHTLAGMHVFEGSKLMISGTRDEAKVAVVHYRRAKELNPEYPDIDNKLEKAKELSLAKIFVFTGPEKDLTLNGNELVRAIEEGLDALEGVEVVRLPNRYATSIADNHTADEIAKGHKANMMLHIEPTTFRTVGIKKELFPMRGVPWERETLILEAFATTDVRYVLINLQNDTVVSEGSFTISDADDGGFEVSAIHHGKDIRSVNLGKQVGWRNLEVNIAPVGESAMGLPAKMKIHDNLTIPDHASETILELPLATYGTGGKIDVGEYSHPADLARITDLNKHTFWLFDAIAYDSHGDGQLSYQLVYQRAFEEGLGGSLAAASYEKDLYRSIEAWMHQPNVQREVMDKFFTKFYGSTVPMRIVEKVAHLFQSSQER